MIFCRNCGKQLDDGEKFCGQCGTATSEIPTTQTQSTHTVMANMSLWQAYGAFWKNYTNFNGRARRTEYWGYFLFNLIFVIGISAIDYTVFATELENWGPLYWLYFLATFIPGLSIIWRRLHDTGKSGANFLWCFTIIGLIPVLIWLCMDSTPGENRFGENPKGIQY